MKKLIPVLLAYVIFVFGCAVGFSFLFGNLPELIPSEVAGYRWIRGCLWFLNLMPAVIFSGIVCGLCVQWRDMKDSSQKYSAASWKRFRNVFILGLVVVLFLTFSQEIFIPSAQKKMTVYKEHPADLRKDLELTEYYLNHRNERLAVQYAEMAYEIDDESSKAIYFYKKTHENLEQTLSELEADGGSLSVDGSWGSDAGASQSGAATSGSGDAPAKSESAIEKVVVPMEAEDSLFTTTELIRKALDAAENGEWFESHYYAVMAQKACAETDTNFAIATEAANLAWSKISNPSDFGNEEQKEYYYTKKRGYSALKAGDNLKAYYIFEGLAKASQDFAQDPDVVRYLELARQRVENDYFFIDETDDIKKMEADSNIYFCIKMADGGKKLVYIDRMATVKQSDGFVRYLDGFYVVEYASNGMLKYSSYVPFAKIVAVSTDMFTPEQLEKLGLNAKWKNVPLVQLQSVDRETEGIVSKPKYAYVPDGLPDEMKSAFGLTQLPVSDHGEGFFASALAAQGERKTMFLELPIDDIDMVGQASRGPDGMNLLQLWKFRAKAESYGFSKEVYDNALVSRCCFPFLVLIMVILLSDFAWAARLYGTKSVFKMRWILVIPFVTLILHFIMKTALYVYSLLNFVLVAAVGEVALIVAMFVYIVLLVGGSLLFMGHNK